MNTTRVMPIGLALLALAACKNEGPKTPVPGAASVALVTSNADDGAVLLTLTGPGVTDAQPASAAYRVYSRLAAPGELHVIVVGDLAATVLITVHVDDLNRLGDYAGTVVDAASRSDAARSSLSGYGVTFAAAH